MSYSGGTITAPVNISDVQNAIGSSSTDLGTLCTSGNINMWAKYKPVKLSSISTINQWDASNNRWKDNATWFHGLSGQVFGLTPYKTSVFSNIVSNTTGGMNGWSYQKPTGGSSSPYRLTDFAGYEHNAPAAIANFIGTTKTANGKTFSASAAMTPGGMGYVSLEEFNTPLYFGVAILNSSGGVVYHGTSSTTGSAYVSFTISGIAQTTYTVYPFLCQDAITPTVGSFSSSHTFWTVPNVSSYTLVVTSPSALTGISATGAWIGSSHNRLTITVKNDGTQDYMGAIYVRRVGRSWVDSAYADEYTSGTLTFTRSSNRTITATGFNSRYNYRAQVRLISGELYEVAIIEDFDPQI